MASELDFSQKLSSEVKSAFLHIQNILKTRETQLLRQIEVLIQQCKLNSITCSDKIKVNFENDNDITDLIQKYGRIDFDGITLDNDMFKIEDYQKPETDHVCLYKCLKNLEKEHSEKFLLPSVINKYINLLQDENTKVDDTMTDAKNDLVSNEETKIKNSDQETDQADTQTNTILQCIEKQDPTLCIHKLKSNSDNEIKDDKHEGTELKDSNVDIKERKRKTNLKTVAASCSVPNLNCKCTDNCTDHKMNHDSLEKFKNKLERNTLTDFRKISDKTCKLSSEHHSQVQQWMKQISVPETEPVQNNDLLEHSHIKLCHKTSL